MEYIRFRIFTEKHIGDNNTAERFFRKMEELKIAPTKVSRSESGQKIYSLDRAVDIWSKENPGCWEEGRGLVGKAGGVFGKSRQPYYWVDVIWYQHPEKYTISKMSFHCSTKALRNYQKEIEALFRDTVLNFDAIYGYISHEIPENRQHISGFLNTRVPGVFWCNYYGSLYVDFFGKEKILSFPWYKTEEFGNNGLITYLAESPNKEILESNELEMKAQAYLGKESFGDLELEKKNWNIYPSITQQCKVPPLEQIKPGVIMKQSKTTINHQSKNVDSDIDNFSKLLLSNNGSPLLYQEYLIINKLDYSLESLKLIEEYLDVLRKNKRIKDDYARVVLRIGTYVGEVIKRLSNKEYHWYDFETGVLIDPYIEQFRGDIEAVYVLYSFDNDTMIFPLAKVGKYLDSGPADSLHFYAQVLLDKDKGLMIVADK